MNLPVTQHEYPFPKGQSLVSTTDLKGRIVHCNAPFITASGFDKSELLGQPHNLIRHPDMPAEAFRDLWDTIAAGRPWSGMVKNRRKDGDHYWVLANVTPLMEADKPVAYMSVRTEPSRAQVEAAEALYARMRAEAEAGRLVHVLDAGQVLQRSILGRLSRLPKALPGLGGWSSYGLVGALGAGLSTYHLGLAMAAVVGAAALAAWLRHTRARAELLPLERYAGQLAAGDLSRDLPISGRPMSRGLELALRQMSVNMRALVADTRAELDRMNESSREIARGNQDLAQRTEAQTASLVKTASSMEEITATVRQSSDTVTRPSGVAGELGEVSRRSADVVHSVNTTMGGIAGSSRRIEEIIQVIDSIAFQTNILALNAAVESARAGVHGRGFAVVASEVRALAQRSSNAAKEIKQLIQDSAQKVDVGAKQTDAARASIDTTLQSVRQFTELIGSIETGAQEQLKGISLVYESIQQMEGITQQNGALVQELARSAAQMLEQADEVTAALRIFRLGDGSGVALPDAVALRRAGKSEHSH